MKINPNLTREEYDIIVKKGTEKPFTGKLLYNKEKGVYACKNCGAEIFSSDAKFDSACGWPSFDKVKDSQNVKLNEDLSFGMKRIEVTCAKCGAHLGHLFDDGPTDTGKRYCINSLSMDFKKT